MKIVNSNTGLKRLMVPLVLVLASGLCHAFQFGGQNNVGKSRMMHRGTFTNANSSCRNVNTKGHLRQIQGHLFMSSPSTSEVAPTTENASKKSKSSPPQLIEFTEPRTKTKVILIGTMHYNPTSIQYVQNTLETLAEQKKLGSVIVESCDIRWNTTMEILKTPRGKLLEPFLTSEMKAASDEALKYGRPCVLGDQRINVTGTSLGNTFRQTFVDVASPFDGGWNRLYREFKEAAEVALPSGEGYLSASSILDPRLLIAAPVSFAKYPLSFLARNPISTLIVFSIIGLLTYLDASGGGSVAFADATLEEQISSIVSSLLFAGLEFGLFGRILVQVLLAERNEIIAKNILDQCKIYSSSYNTKGGNGNIMDMFSFFSGKSQNESDRSALKSDDGTSLTMYVPGSIQENIAVKNDGVEKTVVAVLGMAHCNGIVKLLREELV
jgi:hypothetical protein